MSRIEPVTTILRRAGLRDRHLVALRAMLLSRRPAIPRGRYLTVQGNPHRFGDTLFAALARKGLVLRTPDGFRPTLAGRAFVERLPPTRLYRKHPGRPATQAAADARA